MSNTVNFIRTKFEDYQGVDYGWRAYDDYNQVYDNNGESPMPADDKEFFETIRNNGSVAEFIDFMIEHGVGCYIDAEFYEYSVIKEWLGIKD